jgi:hypothetical protein
MARRLVVLEAAKEKATKFSEKCGKPNAKKMKKLSARK